MDSHRVANDRRYRRIATASERERERNATERQARPTRPAGRRSRSDDGDRARAPIVIPVGLAGAVCIVAAIVSLTLDPPGTGTVAGVAGPAGRHSRRGVPAPIEGVNAGATSLAIVSIVATG